MAIEKTLYGNLPSGEEVTAFTLSHAGLTIKAITYGGIITELHVPGRDGKVEDIVLGLPSLEAYLAGHPWFGAITGRVAGRITGGTFELDGKSFQLELNQPPNHLHGGADALDKKNWHGEAATNTKGEPFLVLTYRSPDGECGYPGNVDIKVTYTLSNDAVLRIDYEATTDRATPFSLTNHSYFNLAGEAAGSVENHVLQIHADHFVPADDELTLSGTIQPVAGQANDFTRPKPLGEALDGLLKQHGDNYMIRRSEPKVLVPVARVEQKSSGRSMEVESTEACLQFYTGKFLDETRVTGKSGRVYQPFDGLCLECQGYPDGVNHPELDDIVLRPDETYRQTTLYKFTTVPV